MFYVFFLFFSSRTRLEPHQNLPLSPVQVCNVNIKEIYLVVFSFFCECCRQSVSGLVQSQRGERQPWRLEDKLNSLSHFFFFFCFVCFFVYWKSKLGGLFIHMFVAALKFTRKHTCTTHPKNTLLYYTQNTNTSCIWSLCFLFPR